MDKIKRNGIFYGALLLNFYILPLLISDTGSAMVMMLFVMPLLCFLISIGYGLKNGFHVLYGMFVALMFIPSIFIFYNESAWIYALAYGMIAFIGNIIVLLFLKK